MALCFCKELIIKIFSKDINLSNLKSSLLALGTLLLNRNKLYNIFIFKPLTSLKSTNKGPRVTSFSINLFPSALTVKASTKSL